MAEFERQFSGQSEFLAKFAHDVYADPEIAKTEIRAKKETSAGSGSRSTSNLSGSRAQSAVEHTSGGIV
jgi:hypothetical protein